ncbi:PFL_4669 family integrating conjugative element protein [Motilimonas pumila]|uniref:TIGR03761 family integrating conjugative element protein n=1 Tax=Motilimonas pumila TaxID=2303987 RepID=A0A418YA54_9GAMM|nr:TIGR03761 family integrating conjugative element protein [Motilimonas pumila]RJG38983.1 TIGR03761 family integrating conjugative element protein [Motilimonas pumila]
MSVEIAYQDIDNHEAVKVESKTDTERLASVVGALRSDISIQIQTKQVHKAWLGKSRNQAEEERQAAQENAKNIHSVMGVPRFFQLVTALENAVKKDDPFADYVFYQLHNEIDSERAEVNEQIDSLNEYMKDKMPSGISLSKNYSVDPVSVPLAINTRLGFLLVYLVLEVDELIRLILLASHCALLSPKNASDATFKATKRIRRAMSFVHRYKFSEVTRDDLAANNARAQEAFKRMPDIELPDEFKDATTRSALAPTINARPDALNVDNDNFFKASGIC